jgi:UPF0042 nucleotide-binding protein
MTYTQRIVIITGLSGAGKTVALRALEDSGFFCSDNFPPQLLQNFINLSTAQTSIERLAIGIDVREKSFLNGIEDTINALRSKFSVRIIFLEAEQSILLRRFKETRRPHPLSISSGGDIKDALDLEDRYLVPLRDLADRVIDTSSYTPHQLRAIIMDTFGEEMNSSMVINLISFGYKFGIPQQVDLLFDIRFLPNPHFVPELRDLNGLDEPVKDYVLKSDAAVRLLDKLKDLLLFLVSEYLREGKTMLTVGIGCTGGMHRSPVVLEELNTFLASHFDVEIKVIHREL